MKNIDNVIVSTLEPTTPCVLWINPSNDKFFYYNNGAWCQINKVDLTNEQQDAIVAALADKVTKGDEATLKAAKEYTVAQDNALASELLALINAESTARSTADKALETAYKAADTTTLSSAKSYTDTKIAEIQALTALTSDEVKAICI